MNPGGEFELRSFGPIECVMDVLYQGNDIIDYFIVCGVHVLFPQIVARLLMKLVWVPSMEGNACREETPLGSQGESAEPRQLL